MIKIGITGSFAKTTVKNVLTTILNQEYKTYCTPSNYNTPLGICRAVKQLPEDCEIFVAEMGARKQGDIAELCDIVKPQYGIITGVGSQHLATFKSKENIYATKKELSDYIDGLNGGVTVFCADNKYSKKMFEESKASEKICLSTEEFLCASKYKKEIKVIKGILNMFDPKLFIDNYSLWERIFEILIVNGQYDTLLDTIKDIFEIIENQMCGKDGTQEGIISKGKECLKKYLLISAYRPIALLGETDINNLMARIYKIYNKKDKYMPIMRSYRITRMFNKYLLPIFIEFVDDSNELKCLYSFDKVVKTLKMS